MKTFVVLLVFASSISASLVCKPSARFKWIQASLSVEEPWCDYTSPNNLCCDEKDPGTIVDLEVACELCYGRTNSTPGFTLDPNNCQKFYMCVPKGDGSFIAHSMTCPDCMFWDDNKLSCVEVDPSCRVSVPVPIGSPNPTFTPDPVVSCITFENDLVSTKGMYVLNNGVTIVNDTSFCPEGNSCGFFNESQLEIPFFSNNYNHLPNLKITFEMYGTTDSVAAALEGVISNDCKDNQAGVSGNSFVFTVTGGRSDAKLIDADDVNYDAHSTYTVAQWQYVVLEFTGSELELTISSGPSTTTLSSPFSGIRESHCPLVIGSLINDAQTTYFQGYIDDICFYVDYQQ